MRRKKIQKSVVYIVSLALISLLIISCQDGSNRKNYTQYVDPFIGTGAHGHTYPGASLPFGMVQLSPDTRLDTWDGCSGYHYSDSSIIGFSHTHLSGTGVSDYGDILFLPFTGDNKWEPGKKESPDTGYRSRFSHKVESASPGFYSVHLKDDAIDVELTTTTRVGFHKYEYPKGDTAKILIDLSHRDPLVDAFINQISDTEIEGYRRSKLWAGDQYVYFVARFSEPISHIEFKQAEKEAFTGIPPAAFQKAVLTFEKTNSVKVKVALSAVDCEGARKNLETELSDWNFTAVKEEANEIWNEHLGRIEVEGGNRSEMRNFYTAFYHSLLTPNISSDVDGAYRGMDLKVHRDENFTNYTVFSLWDTFRTLHPLLTITHPEEAGKFCESLIRKGEQFGEIPMWELASNDTRCMIGYHGVSVLADFILKYPDKIDVERAFEVMTKSAHVEKRGINYYRELGFVPYNRSSQAVSKTLEYAYNDWCIAQVAKHLGKTDDYNYYMGCSQFYKNLYDQESGFMRPRDDKHQWEDDFDPMRVGFSYTEGNSFQYSLFVPHDIEGLKELVGGEMAFEKWLDRLFATEIDHDLGEDTDVTGLIGNYAHGNEPSHHLAYLYNYTSSPWKAQKRTHQILTELYQDNPAGICGNEDCGQMSAWYVMSAMGIYSVNPGGNTYALTSPLFEKVKLNLPNGKCFTISVDKSAQEDIFIKDLLLNGESYHLNFINHDDLIQGGEIKYTLTGNPDQAISYKGSDQRKSLDILPIPHTKNRKDFIGKTQVSLFCDVDDALIYYTLDGTEPTDDSRLYTQPFEISASCRMRVKAFKEGYIPSVVFEKDFIKSNPERDNKLSPGLNYNVYNGIYRSVYDWKNDEPVKSGNCPVFSLGCRERDEWYGLNFSGYIFIPSDDEYTFTVMANDGCQMKINGEELFESDGRKSHSLMQRYKLAMKAGYHQIELNYYQCSDANELTVCWESSQMKKAEIPASKLFH